MGDTSGIIKGGMWKREAFSTNASLRILLNLMSDFAHLGMFDLVFCRNVLIYFDQRTKVDLLDRLAQVIAPDGYLVLGAAETVVGLTDSFTIVPEKHGLYAPKPRLPLRWAAGGKAGPRLVAVSGGR
jgi:chemotaxis protein methyltransferase CheR